MHSQETGLALLLTAGLALAGCVSSPCACPARAANAPAAFLPSVAAPPEPGPQTPAGWGSYVIRPGDTLAMIAACRDVPIDALARVNEIDHFDWIVAGATLKVPAEDLCAARRVALARHRSNLAEATVRRAVAAPESGSRSDGEFERGQRLLAAARARYDAADFEGSLSDADAAAGAFARAANHPEASTRRARAHMVAGIAAVGLEEHDRALAELRRAVTLDPEASLGPDDRSPRLVELFRLAHDASPVSAHR